MINMLKFIFDAFNYDNIIKLIDYIVLNLNSINQIHYIRKCSKKHKLIVPIK